MSASVPAYRQPTYLRYVAGQAVSILGDQVWYVALSWAAVQLASPGIAGVVLSVSSIPRLALLLFGGAFVDRYGPRRLMIGSDFTRFVVCAVAAGIALSHPGLALLITVALVFGIADAVFLPASGALVPRLLPADQLTSGAALSTVVSRLALTVGAPVGGVLVAVGGLPLAAAVDGVTFLVSMLALWSVRPAPTQSTVDTPRTPLLRSLRDGLTYLRGHQVLRALLIAGLLMNIGFVGPMNVGLALVSTERGWAASGIGVMLSGFGIGAVVGALVMMRVRPQGAVGLLAAMLSVIQGVSVFAIAVAPSLPLAVAATAVAGLTSGPLAIIMGSLSQSRTDDAYRGRVSSVNALASLGITPLAMAATGVAVAMFGMVPTFAVSGGLELVAAAICVLVPALRTARLSGPTAPKSANLGHDPREAAGSEATGTSEPVAVARSS